MKRAARFAVFSLKLSITSFGNRLVHSGNAANYEICKKLKNSEPLLISRFGSTETRALIELGEIEEGKREKFSDEIMSDLNKLCGMFPVSQEVTKRFSQLLKNVVLEMDICGVRAQSFEFDFWLNEHQAISTLKPDAIMVDIDELTPLQIEENWISNLDGKKVLVIHPFAETIESQFRSRGRLIRNRPNYLNFEMTTYKPIQSLGWDFGNDQVTDWFEALESMKKDLMSVGDFDVALIGAGAYGVFLGAHIKSLGKQAIHIGGALQLFFGIKGNRWMANESSIWVKNVVNEYWVWPSDGETPINHQAVEGGAYWK
jgi:hypothetical protein